MRALFILMGVIFLMTVVEGVIYRCGRCICGRRFEQVFCEGAGLYSFPELPRRARENARSVYLANNFLSIVRGDQLMVFKQEVNVYFTRQLRAPCVEVTYSPPNVHLFGRCEEPSTPLTDDLLSTAISIPLVGDTSPFPSIETTEGEKEEEESTVIPPIDESTVIPPIEVTEEVESSEPSIEPEEEGDEEVVTTSEPFTVDSDEEEEEEEGTPASHSPSDSSADSEQTEGGAEEKAEERKEKKKRPGEERVFESFNSTSFPYKIPSFNTIVKNLNTFSALFGSVGGGVALYGAYKGVKKIRTTLKGRGHRRFFEPSSTSTPRRRQRSLTPSIPRPFSLLLQDEGEDGEPDVRPKTKVQKKRRPSSSPSSASASSPSSNVLLQIQDEEKEYEQIELVSVSGSTPLSSFSHPVSTPAPSPSLSAPEDQDSPSSSSGAERGAGVLTRLQARMRGVNVQSNLPY